MKRPDEILRLRIEELCHRCGSLRGASRALAIDHGYLARLATGEKTNPSDAVLRKLGLQRVVTYRKRARV